jgi:hypothetical protein
MKTFKQETILGKYIIREIVKEGGPIDDSMAMVIDDSLDLDIK